MDWDARVVKGPGVRQMKTLALRLLRKQHAHTHTRINRQTHLPLGGDLALQTPPIPPRHNKHWWAEAVLVKGAAVGAVHVALGRRPVAQHDVVEGGSQAGAAGRAVDVGEGG